jgi:hypothetical protein
VAHGKRNEPRTIATPADAAYAAGFIDGEGCISISVARGSWIAKLTITQVDPAPLKFMMARWGGAIQVKKPQTPTRAVAFEWRIVARQFYRCMDVVLPFLIVKRRSANNALRLRGLRDCRGRARAMTPSEQRLRGQIKARSHVLNQRGPRER